MSKHALYWLTLHALSATLRLSLLFYGNEIAGRVVDILMHFMAKAYTTVEQSKCDRGRWTVTGVLK